MQREYLQKGGIDGMVAMNLQESDTAVRAGVRAHNANHQPETGRGKMIQTGIGKGTGIEIELMIWKVKGGSRIAVKKAEVESGMIMTEREAGKEIGIGGDV